MCVCYLCSGEEDFISDMAEAAGRDTQAHAREDVSIVSLARIELPPARQGHGVKRAAASKDAPPLQMGS